MKQKNHQFNKHAGADNADEVRKMRTPSEEVTKEVGLLAFGSSDGWDISVDESLDGPERWYADINGHLYLCISNFSIQPLLAKKSIFLRDTSPMVRALAPNQRKNRGKS